MRLSGLGAAADWGPGDGALGAGDSQAAAAAEGASGGGTGGASSSSLNMLSPGIGGLCALIKYMRHGICAIYIAATNENSISLARTACSCEG